MPAIELRGVSKSFAAKLALSGVSFSADAQQITVISGISGVGKTTLLRIVAGLERPDSGTIHIADRDVTRQSAGTRGLAYLTQDYALYPQLSVRQNLEAALSPLGLQPADREQRIAEALSWFHLESVERHIPAQLSGGQAQRTALAKAVVRRPEVLLLDEPLSQLDTALKEELRLLLLRLAEHFRMTLLMVTHDPLDALSLATRVGVLEQGRLVQFDSPSVVYQRPVSRVAAELLSPFGVNWLPRSSLPAEWQQGKTEWVGFRPDCAVLQPAQDTLSGALLNARDAEVPPRPAESDRRLASPTDVGLSLELVAVDARSLGFANSVLLDYAGQSLRCLVPNDSPVELGKARLHIPRTKLLEVD